MIIKKEEGQVIKIKINIRYDYYTITEITTNNNHNNYYLL